MDGGFVRIELLSRSILVKRLRPLRINRFLKTQHFRLRRLILILAAEPHDLQINLLNLFLNLGLFLAQGLVQICVFFWIFERS